MMKLHSFFSKFFFLFFFTFSFQLFAQTPPSIGVIEITGKELPGFSQKDISQIRAQIYKNGKWEPIPFQIDEKTNVGSGKIRKWVLDNNPKAVGDKKLDTDEVVLLMVKDLGQPAPAGTRFPAAGVQIQINQRFAYLFFDAANLAVSSQQYVHYNPGTETISGISYQNRYQAARPIILEEMNFKGPAGDTSVNLLDRFKVRINLAIRHFFDFKIQEDEITSKKLGVREGPIRIIRRVVAYKALGPIRVSPKAESDLMYYPYFLRSPSTINNPLDGPESLEEKSNGYAGFDFRKSIYGSQFYSDKNLTPVTLDGSMNENEKNLKLQENRWWMLTGPYGSFLVTNEWDPKLTRAGVTADLYYKDDQSASGAPESESGECVIGFQLNYAKIPKGDYSLFVNQIYLPEKITPTQVGAFLNDVQTRAAKLQEVKP